MTRGAAITVVLTLALVLACQRGDPSPPPPTAVESLSETLRVPPDPRAGFHHPYLLYRPSSLQVRGGRLLVIPNNSGRVDDDPGIHEREARRELEIARRAADRLGYVLLMPVFPRPASHSNVYTHALDRDSLTVDDPALARLDLQLIAMIDDAGGRLRSAGVMIERRVALSGFSAAGMFANRFALLHPDRVVAVAVGSPGGWPIAPLTAWRGQPLRYPVGLADVGELTGAAPASAALREVAFFFYLGDADANDSVPFDDGYDAPDRDAVMGFGKTQQARWEVAQQMYAAARCDAEFKLYPGTGHTVTQVIRDDVERFLARFAHPD